MGRQSLVLAGGALIMQRSRPHARGHTVQQKGRGHAHHQLVDALRAIAGETNGGTPSGQGQEPVGPSAPLFHYPLSRYIRGRTPSAREAIASSAQRLLAWLSKTSMPRRIGRRRKRRLSTETTRAPVLAAPPPFAY
ncbi:hypothetical protein HYPSUDRAFT_204690 [Hypholoma sublateritium FD-334 SS-4]|uniref:Uncharacterized protein n=1 Tax=Hypholoma sublateritium (strain FD-334 SS-4) TaxID=945553 RepID=A0A0D2NK73_HYPSF|nr:hypothetical protein HYPSUDRAFT_204690 [Hypholoma sublateritium FD-334 SS-4]